MILMDHAQFVGKGLGFLLRGEHTLKVVIFPATEKDEIDGYDSSSLGFFVMLLFYSIGLGLSTP